MSTGCLTVARLIYSVNAVYEMHHNMTYIEIPVFLDQITGIKLPLLSILPDQGLYVQVPHPPDLSTGVTPVPQLPTVLHHTLHQLTDVPHLSVEVLLCVSPGAVLEVPLHLLVLHH